MATVTGALASPRPQSPGLVDRLLAPFSKVHAGEGATALLMLVSLFILMTGYSVLKAVREPLVLATGSAELAAYASAGQALTLMGFIPLYGWVASRVPRMGLIATVTGFFLVTLQLFYFGVLTSLPLVGFLFFIWLGVFNMSAVAQFWSFGNDIYRREGGERLFPLIQIGGTAGAPLGAWIAGRLFQAGTSIPWMLQLAAALIVVHLLLYVWISRRREKGRDPAMSAPPEAAVAEARAPLTGAGGFQLVFRSRYLLLIAVLFVLLNFVNSTGEYILRRTLVNAASGLASEEARRSFIGAFASSYQLWVNIIAVVLQALVVSRLVRYVGMAGMLLILPIIALGSYGLIATGVGLAAIRWAKTAENAVDYSVMNTGRQMLWLPTDPDQKYKAKQATDTFFVRVGDLLAAAAIFGGTTWLALGATGFAWINMVVILVWLVVALQLFRLYRTLCQVCL
jgi:AAA family ATP:ADP antiporter